MIKGGGLKKYVITRWTTAYDCTDSIIRCKNALKQQNFFRNVKDLRTILLPIKKAIINLEHKSTTLTNCFINLVIMATAIKELSQTNTGLQINTFRIICEKALSIWKLLGGREKSANKLIAQISNYSLKSKPYDFEFVTGIHTVKNWWLMCKQQNNHIQKLASCERYFSILDLRTILLPIKKAIINLEHKSTTLTNCFINLVIMATAIKELSQTNTGLQINTFRIICEKALSIWKLLGGREKSANKLIAQISNYSLKSKPYDFEFVTGIHTVKNWWLMCKQQNNHIQKLASCERYFSILGWY
ncbi:hypothetical protein Glove_437g51 [Diversispora epigaea]|uniref:Uncharacterized protein n=1 Tax=Diversispora epigaea TaxID=1348612 RepID=A0A397GRV5_9GLOM|nr:hypothetical protein Glove_437g51 [Diversispora epigaea]